jgi:hypothetical protein
VSSRCLALGAALLLTCGAATRASAAGSDTEDEEQDVPVKPKKGHKAAPPPAVPAKTEHAKKSEAPRDEARHEAHQDAHQDAHDAPADEAAPEDAKAGAAAEEEAPPPAAVPEKIEAAPDRPISFQSNGWTASLYGFAELDIMGDTTRSFLTEGALNYSIARPNTVLGDNPALHITARNSRFGFSAEAPVWNSIKAKAVVEMDFFGNQALGTSQTDVFTNGTMRMRLFYLKLDTPIVDIIAGQYHDLFGWNGGAFYPNTVAYLPVLGEVYHRNPQLRVSKTVGGPVSFQIAAAAVRPVQSDAALPDVQAGAKVTFNGWRGAAVPGASRPTVAPAALGLSVIGRHLAVNDFSATPGNPQRMNTGGVAANVFLPLIPASGNDLSGALSVTGEVTYGAGISDMYPGLTGGVGFPSLPNPNNTQVVPQYTPDIDPGIVTFDANFQLQAVKWTGLVGNFHYHLPVADGRKLWVSGTASMVKSSNALDLTPQAGQQFTWNKGLYADGNLWIGLTPYVQMALSVQWMQQTYGDQTTATNLRGEGSFYMYF